MWKFLEVLIWQLRESTRFPILEFLAALLVFQVFYASLFAARGVSFLFFPEWGVVQSLMVLRLMREIARSLLSAYIPTTFIVVVIATMSLAYQFETGLMKMYFSLPAKRSHYFFAKFFVCFLIPFIMLIVTSLLTEFFLNPIGLFFLFVSPEALVGTLLLTGEMVFFIVSVSVAVSLFSRHTAVSLISSLVILYSLELLGGSMELPILPPKSLSHGLFQFFFFSQNNYWRQYPGWEGIGVLALTPVVSLSLVLISYVYYSKRLEL
jgi:hypothetical protein